MVKVGAWSAVAAMLLPVVGLLAGLRPAGVAGLGSPDVLAAAGVSLWTSTLAMGVTVLAGLPVAWTLARSERPVMRVLVVLPVVLPPAVLGVALLETFGRQGLLGGMLWSVGVQLPFTALAVVVAQVMVALPLFVLPAEEAFRAIDDDVILVARTLGARPAEVARRVVLPMVAPGLLAGLGLAWARALGEFGATLLFAGNLPGRTSTVPLALFTLLETDPPVATAAAAALLVVTAVLVGVLGGGRARR
jgi:molybdate transport system permease protein